MATAVARALAYAGSYYDGAWHPNGSGDMYYVVWSEIFDAKTDALALAKAKRHMKKNIDFEYYPELWNRIKIQKPWPGLSYVNFMPELEPGETDWPAWSVRR